MPLKPDVIHTDAPAATEQGSLPDLNDPNASLSRADAMAVMRARRRESFVAEMDPVEAKDFLAAAPPITTADPNADPDADAGDAEAAAARARLEAAAAAEKPEPIDAGQQLEAQRSEELILSDEDLAKYKIRTKVNGKEEFLTVDQVRAGFQKTAAADQYLAESKALWAEVRQAQQAQQTAAPTEKTPAPTSTGSDEAADGFVEAMFQGDTDAAKARIKELVTGRAMATPDDLVRNITRAVKLDLVKESALRQFEKDHAVVMADPMLKRVADTFLLEETGGVPLEKMDPELIPEILDRTGKRTTEWLAHLPTAAPAQARATTRDEKRALKAGIDELPAAATRAASTVPPPKSPSDRIAEMAAARGQALHRP
jgi:hypothetical protein